MLSRRVISPVVLIACVSIAASSFAAERPVLDTVEDIEDVRLLWSATAYRVHQLDTLLRYAKGFGAEVDPGEATDWHEQALYVLEWLKSLDDAGMGLMAWQDYRQREADVSEDVRRTRALLGDVADRVTRLHDRLQRRVTEVRGQVDDLARERGLQPPAARATEPWAEPQREIGREMGFALSWFMWMNRDRASRHAALDRQQNLEVDYLLNKAAKIGVRSIVPEFSGHENLESCSWRVCEPKPGEYDFSRIDANIEKIAEHGMVTVVPIRSMTTDPPDWAIEQFGDESRMWRHDEKTDETAPTQGVNLMHRRTREAFGAYLAALVSHLSKTHTDRVMAITMEEIGRASCRERV